jgi:hypothetical protein
MGALQALTFRLAAHAISLRVLDAGGMARNADPHRQAEIQPFLVGQA